MLALALFATCIVGAIVPGFGSEAAVVGALALADGSMHVALTVVAAGAQSTGKLVLLNAVRSGAQLRPPSFLRWAPVHQRTRARSRPGAWWRRAMPGVRGALERSPACAAAVIFVSAMTSVPPLYATTIACAAVSQRQLYFWIAVFAGRTLRYTAFLALLESIGTALR